MNLSKKLIVSVTRVRNDSNNYVKMIKNLPNNSRENDCIVLSNTVFSCLIKTLMIKKLNLVT